MNLYIICAIKLMTIFIISRTLKKHVFGLLASVLGAVGAESNSKLWETYMLRATESGEGLTRGNYTKG
jgi:hypothetical protein